MQYLTIMFLFFFNITLLTAAINPNAGSSSARFLKMSTGARSSALADATTSLDKDIESLFNNPAGLAALDQNVLGFYYANLYEGLNLSTVSFGMPLRNIGVIGLGLMGLLYGDIPVVTVDSEGNLNRTGTTTANDLALVISISRSFSDNISFGLNVKAISQSIEAERSWGLGFDIGELVHLADLDPVLGEKKAPLALGIVVQNIGTKSKFMSDSYDLPFLIKIGLNYQWMNLINSGHFGLILVDMEKAADDNINLNFGMEYSYQEWSFIRFGYKIGADLNYFTLGAGIRIGITKFNKIRVNYAWAPYEKLGNTHRISLIWTF